MPVGYADKVKEMIETDNVIFAPEFLREGKALLNNLFSSRIAVSEQSERAKVFADMLIEGTIKKIFQYYLMNLPKQKQFNYSQTHI